MHNTSLYKTMRKILYILFFALVGLSACTNNSDEIPPEPVPPVPSPPTDLKPEDLYGKWEIYYSTKAVVENPDDNPKPAPLFRDIEWDGFTYDLGKKDGEYYFISYNVIGELIRKGTYEAKGDSMIFHWDSIAPDNEVFPFREGRRITELDNEKGIIKWDRQYRNITKDGNTIYRITDLYCSRDLDKAPNSTSGVNPPKVKIDFNDLCRGKWVMKGCDVYYDGDRQPGPSLEVYEIMAGSEYKFYLDEDGDKMCSRTTRDRETGVSSTKDYPVVIVDDVIHYIFWKDGELKSNFSWIEKFNNADSYNDINITRYSNDLKVVLKESWRMEREL